MAKKINEYIKDIIPLIYSFFKVFRELWLFFPILYTFSLYITNIIKDYYDFTHNIYFTEVLFR